MRLFFIACLVSGFFINQEVFGASRRPTRLLSVNPRPDATAARAVPLRSSDAVTQITPLDRRLRVLKYRGYSAGEPIGVTPNVGTEISNIDARALFRSWKNSEQVATPTTPQPFTKGKKLGVFDIDKTLLDQSVEPQIRSEFVSFMEKHPDMEILLVSAGSDAHVAEIASRLSRQSILEGRTIHCISECYGPAKLEALQEVAHPDAIIRVFGDSGGDYSMAFPQGGLFSDHQGWLMRGSNQELRVAYSTREGAFHREQLQPGQYFLTQNLGEALENIHLTKGGDFLPDDINIVYSSSDPSSAAPAASALSHIAAASADIPNVLWKDGKPMSDSVEAKGQWLIFTEDYAIDAKKSIPPEFFTHIEEHPGANLLFLTEAQKAQATEFTKNLSSQQTTQGRMIRCLYDCLDKKEQANGLSYILEASGVKASGEGMDIWVSKPTEAKRFELTPVKSFEIADLEELLD